MCKYGTMKNNSQLISVLAAFFILLPVFAGAIRAQAPTPVPEPKSSETKTELDRVFNELMAEPDWLFGDEVCPFSVMPAAQLPVEKFKQFPKGCVGDARLCVEKCREGDGWACYSTALALQSNKGLEQTLSERFFYRGCKLGVASACTNRAASILHFGLPQEPSIKCAVSTFEKTCEWNDPWGCVMFATMLSRGMGRPRNDELAVKVLDKACKNGEHDEACIAGRELLSELKHEKIKTKP